MLLVISKIKLPFAVDSVGRLCEYVLSKFRYFLKPQIVLDVIFPLVILCSVMKNGILLEIQPIILFTPWADNFTSLTTYYQNPDFYAI